MKKNRKHRNIIRVLGMCVFNCLFRHRKIQRNKIFFLNFSNEYDCNPKYICEEFLKQKLNYQLVFATKKGAKISGIFPDNVKVVFKGTPEFYKEIYSSKVIIENDIRLAFLGFHKKKGQIVFETWHGSLGIKAFGRSANYDPLWQKMADKSAAMTDYIISNSTFENKIYKETFWQNNEILLYGHARNDVLYVNDKAREQIKEKVCKFYKLDENNKLCLFAPTFRDDNNQDVYELDFEKLAKTLEARFGGRWTILFRLHHLTNETLEGKRISKNVVDVSDYPDIQEIAAVIDCGITDYSSWICEYVLRKKPGFIYALDLDKYRQNERPLTVKLDDLPFPLAENSDELFKAISMFDEKKYVEKCAKFLKLQGSVDDGYAAARVIKKIEELLK